MLLKGSGGPGDALEEIEMPNIKPNRYEEVVRLASRPGGITFEECMRALGLKSREGLFFYVRAAIARGRPDDIRGITVTDLKRKDHRISIVDSLEQFARFKAASKARVCRYCGLSGQLAGQKSNKPRSVCDSCSVDHDMRATNPDHTRTWRDDPRWQEIVQKRHQERGGCLVCGSSRSQERDGRYCDWRHDPVMLSASELEALLERHAAQETRYDIWGNVLR
jgi:hypothetical protein